MRTGSCSTAETVCKTLLSQLGISSRPATPTPVSHVTAKDKPRGRGFQKMAEGSSGPEEELERAAGDPEQEGGGERGDEVEEQKSEPTAARSGKKVSM